MKKVFLAVFAMFAMSNAKAQNLGQRYDWLQNSYLKIPTQGGLPHYDTLVKYGNLFSENQVMESASRYLKLLRACDSVAVVGNKIMSKLTYNIYTDEKHDEEHTYTVSYLLELSVKSGKYSVSMHDFDISFLTNTVDFQTKIKHAKDNDGRANYFMALFHDQNNLEIKKLTDALNGKFDEKATASN